MPILSIETQRRAHDGRIDSLLDIRTFCAERNVKDDSTFTSILNIVLYNLRPELHPPHLSRASAFPNSAQEWLHGAVVCASILTESITSLSSSCPDPPLDSSSTPLSTSNCSQMSRYFSTHIWPCIAIVINWYILDDFQAAISADVHQESMNTAVYQLLIHLQKPEVGLQRTMLKKKGIASSLTRLFLQSLDWSPHPTVAIAETLAGILLADIAAAVEEAQNHPQFLPSLVSHLKHRGKITSAQLPEMKSVIHLVRLLLHNSRTLAQRTAAEYPAVLEELMRIWCAQLPVLEKRSFNPATPEDIQRADMITHISWSVSCLLQSGGLHTQRQAVKKHLLQCMLRTNVIFDSLQSTTTTKQWPSTAIWMSYFDIMAALKVRLCFYSLLSPVLRQLQQITSQKLDDFFSNVAVEDFPEKYFARWFKGMWTEFRQFAASRESLMAEFKEGLSQRSTCDAPTCLTETPTRTKRRCEGCKYSHYCSRQCQKNDWAAHKSWCIMAQTMGELIPKLDSLDSRYLEYQTNYDIAHIHKDQWLVDGNNFEPNTVHSLTCNYRKLPPTFSFSRQPGLISPASVPGPRVIDPSSIWVVLYVGDHTDDANGALCGFANRSVIETALAGGAVQMKKGDRVFRIQGTILLSTAQQFLDKIPANQPIMMTRV